MKPKILLLHGWNYKNYNSCINSNSYLWNQNFLNELEKHFSIQILIFPGFFGQKEPKEKEWFLENYSDFVYDFLKENQDIKYILGFSFGGAVALNLKNEYKTNQKIILISPAIFRKVSKKNISIPKFVKKIIPKFILNFFKKIYLIYIVKNPFYKHGSKFLQKSYLNIVKIDLRKTLLKFFKNKDILIIFGNKDTATPHFEIQKILENQKDFQKEKIENFFVLKNSTHKVHQENPKEVTKIISNFCFQN